MYLWYTQTIYNIQGRATVSTAYMVVKFLLTWNIDRFQKVMVRIQSCSRTFWLYRLTWQGLMMDFCIEFLLHPGKGLKPSDQFPGRGGRRPRLDPSKIKHKSNGRKFSWKLEFETAIALFDLMIVSIVKRLAWNFNCSFKTPPSISFFSFRIK